MKRAVVVGAGLGGLSCAALLAKEGYEVTLVEKNSAPGGRARSFRSEGFTFDMGPSWYLMPEVFERFFGHFGCKPTDFFELTRLRPSYRMFFDNNDQVDVPDNPDATAALFDQLEPHGGDSFRRYLSESHTLYDAAMDGFVYRHYDLADRASMLDFLRQGAKGQRPPLHVFSSIGRHVRRQFISDRARKILMYNIVFLGGNPVNTPALYSIMAHVDFNLGVWYPRGGFGRLVDALAEIARREGVRTVYGASVHKIIVNSGVARGVLTDRGVMDADLVVIGADYPHAEMELLAPEWQSYPASYWKKRVIAPSAFMMYVGVGKRLNRLQHHNLVLAHDWERHFADIFDHPSWPDAPSYYVSCPSRTDTNVAPAGCENMVILVPVAPGLADSRAMRELYADKILTHLEAVLHEDIRSHLLFRRIYSHRDFIEDYNAYRGTALGLTHTLGQSAFFRPKLRSSRVMNLFYTGQYAQPGIGAPMVLIASELVRNLVRASPQDGAVSAHIFRHGSRTYYNASRFFPKGQRDAITALYAFVRTADDMVDDVPQRANELDRLTDLTNRALAGETTGDSVVDDMAELARRKAFEHEWVHDFLGAMSSDLTKSVYTTMEELNVYMYGSAEVIGLMIARIHDLDADAYDHARMLGRSMQFLNFIRDILEDYRLGRQYLPAEDLRRFGLPDLSPRAALSNRDRAEALIRHELAKYREMAREAVEGLGFLPRYARIPVRTAHEMYMRTAARIEADPLIVYRQKVKPRRLRILLQGMIESVRS